MLFNKTKVIPWKEFFRVEADEYVTLRVIPDRTLDNRQNYKIIRALHDLYKAPLERVGLGKWHISYKPLARVWYDVVLTEKEIKFYFSVPKSWESYVSQKIAAYWPKASIEEAERREIEVPEECTQVAEMSYKRHNIFALEVDRAKDTQPLGAIMQASKDMKEGDQVRLSICMEPTNRMNWSDEAEKAHKEFGKGKTPQRTGITSRKALLSVGKLLESTFAGLSNLVLLILGHDENKNRNPDYEKREIMLDGKLENATRSKRNEPTFKTRIRITSHSKSKDRRELNTRAVSNAYVEVAGDNELERVDLKKRPAMRVVKELNTYKIHPLHYIDLDPTIMSTSELGKLTQLPGAGLQDEHAEQLETIKLRQSELPSSITSEGMHIGTQELKGKNLPVYMPTKDHDELCLPRVGIGGMGTGKTKGFGANWAVQAVRNKYGCLVIDPAKRELGDELEKVLDKDQLIRVDLSKTVISLDWNEVKYSPRAKTRLANTMIEFFNTSNDDAGAQTTRYIRAAVMGMKTGRLSEILKIFEDEVYRKKLTKEMPDGIAKTTLESFTKESDGMKRKILSPIYNRMDIILGDPYLEACMDAEKGLDLVKIMSQRKVVVIDIPSSFFDPSATDLIVNLLATKLDIAMRLREESGAEEFPFFAIFDEPHQFLRSAKLWKSAAVESRKYRLGYVWLFHSWEQIPKDLAEIIKAAGPHYHLYTSSQKTYKDLSMEIAPFTVEEALKTPRFHAINILRTGGEIVKPFMARMTPPPSMQKKAQ